MSLNYDKAVAKTEKEISKNPSLIQDEFRLKFRTIPVPAVKKTDFFTILTPVFHHSSLATTTVKALTEAVRNEQIQSYNNNRGTGRVREAWVKEKADSFYPDGFGMVALVSMGNGQYAISEGHNRIQTLLYMLQNGVTEYDEVVIPIQIVNDKTQFMDVYRTVNTSHNHTISDKLTNPDYAYGREIRKFLATLDSYEYKGIKLMNSDNVKQTAGMLLALQRPNHQSLTFKELQKLSSGVHKVANLLPEETTIIITQKARADLRDAFNFTLKVMREVVDQCDISKGTKRTAPLTDLGKKTLGSAMFFSLLVWDKYSSEGTLTDIDHKRIVTKLTSKNASATMKNLSLLSTKSMDTALTAFYEIIRTNKKVV